MDHSANSPPLPGSPQPPQVPELVLQTGKHAGVRRPLAGALTVIGRAPECDLRLNLEGVEPVHCVIVLSQGNLIVRNFGSTVSTLLNGQPLTTSTLTNKDVLTFGPFQFQLALPDDWEKENARPEKKGKAQRDALRIQAAAVVAQQTALSDREQKLEAKETTLKKQHEQLVGHLDERRQRITQAREELKNEREAWNEEKANQERFLREAWKEVDNQRASIEEKKQELKRQEKRLADLRSVQKTRFKERWGAKQEELQHKEADIRLREDRLQAESNKLAREREELSARVVRHNGEREVSRRQLQQGWDELRSVQKAWLEQRSRETAELTQAKGQLDERVSALVAAQKSLKEEKARWDQLLRHLQHDIQGLDNRIRNQRTKLVAQEQHLTHVQQDLQAIGAHSTLTPPVPVSQGPSASRGEKPTKEMQLAEAALTDQRRHVLEQWVNVLRVQETWEKERQALLAELEQTTFRLGQRETQIETDEAALQERRTQLEQHAGELARLRGTLEVWQSKLLLGKEAWESERRQHLKDVQAREVAALVQMRRVRRQRRRCMKRLNKDVQLLTEAQQQTEELRFKFLSSWKECEERQHFLLSQQQEITRQNQALERYRQEFLAGAPDLPASEKLLEKYARELTALTARGDKQVKRDRQTLQGVLERMEARGNELHAVHKALVHSRKKTIHKCNRREDELLKRELLMVEQQREMERMSAAHKRDQEMLKSLQEEVDRLARLLIDDDSPLVVHLAEAEPVQEERGAA
jgi:pSer/pThr/pTyr-binding forkhead associated (FHA) protein